MIDGSTRLVGLIGWPVEHSLSPAIHNAAFEAVGLNWRYVPLPVVPGMEGESLRGLAALGFAGANVTVPHKSTLVAALDSVTPDAKAIGAVNTIVVRRDGEETPSLHGHNTDHAGFVDALQATGFDVAGQRAVVVGAGGAARAVIFGLLAAGLSEAIVLSRNVERAEQLAEDLGRSDSGRLQAQELTVDVLVESSRTASLLVNATPVGMWPHEEASVWPEEAPLPADLLVYDLVYVPRETRLLRQARDAGASGVGGLDMFLEQGARAFTLWTEKEPPKGIMRRACEEQMERRFG
ncbi:MAG: shikimate dehydrogenase [Candidatus Bipolaricaulia bacterium]